MERLAGQTRDDGRPDATVLSLLDAVWNMHPDADAQEILACALEAQVRHLAKLPVAGRWMVRFLRDLPTFVPVDAPIPARISEMIEDDVVFALALRRSLHGDSGDAVYDDALSICRLALRHLPPGTVCRISVRAYEQAKGDAPGDHA